MKFAIAIILISGLLSLTLKEKCQKEKEQTKQCLWCWEIINDNYSTVDSLYYFGTAFFIDYTSIYTDFPFFNSPYYFGRKQLDAKDTVKKENIKSEKYTQKMTTEEAKKELKYLKQQILKSENSKVEDAILLKKPISTETLMKELAYTRMVMLNNFVTKSSRKDEYPTEPTNPTDPPTISSEDDGKRKSPKNKQSSEDSPIPTEPTDPTDPPTISSENDGKRKSPKNKQSSEDSSTPDEKIDKEVTKKKASLNKIPVAKGAETKSHKLKK